MKEQLRSFLEFLRLNRNASPHTVAAYDSDLSQFLSFAADHHRTLRAELRPEQVDLSTVRAFMADLYRQGQARSSVSRKLSALRTFTRYMRREGWIEGDPVALAASPKREQIDELYGYPLVTGLALLILSLLTGETFWMKVPA